MLRVTVSRVEDLGEWDVLVVGGGLVGMGAGLGMARQGARVLILDASDTTFRASRGNFGLVWVQSKGVSCRDYAIWTRRSVELWPGLEDEIRELSGVQLHYERGLGVHLCLGEDEFHNRSEMVRRVVAHRLPRDDTRMIERDELREMVPSIGERVTGASVSSFDGACDPLSLYRGLWFAAQAAGARVVSNKTIDVIVPETGGYRISGRDVSARGARVLIAAGLATDDLARSFDFPPIVLPQKGQILVTERAEPTVPVVTSAIRQTAEGTILIGDTKEDEIDDRSASQGILRLARRAVALFPCISQLRIVRSWAAVRVLTRDGNPFYDESPTHPGVFVAVTHSGVTLAPVHHGPLAQWVLGGETPPEFASFSARRLN